MERLKTAQVVVLDEIGGERTSDWARDVLLGVLDGLLGRGARIVGTTNLDDFQRAARLGQRAASRLATLPRHRVDASDYRRAGR